MNHTRQSPTQPPLCVIRRDVEEHFVAIDRAKCDLQLSRAGMQSLDQSLSDRMSQIRRRLDAAQRSLSSTGKQVQPRAAALCADAELPVRRPSRDGMRPGVSRLVPAGSPRQTRLRLYSPPSPV